MELVDFLKDPSRYARVGARLPKGCLLVGPPGTGKTLLARAVAGEAGVPFFNASASEFVELYVGMGAVRVRSLFGKAKAESPCIVFIDEIDAIGKRRDGGQRAGMGGNDEREQTLNELLTQLDGFEPNSGVIVLAATNRADVLDPALRRPGRFDRVVAVDRPDKAGREAILGIHVRKQSVRLAEGVTLGAIAQATIGFAGADLANVVNESALLAARGRRDVVEFEDLKKAVERALAGIEKKSAVLSVKEKEIVSRHEVGHALVGAAVEKLIPGTGLVEKISIVPRSNGALGFTYVPQAEDRNLMFKDEMLGRLATLLGGRAAEELCIGRVSTGASDDLQKATDLAYRAVTLYGLSERVGPVAVTQTAGGGGGNVGGGGGYDELNRVQSLEVRTAVDEEVRDILDGAIAMARAVLLENQGLVVRLSEMLEAEENLEGDSLAEMLAEVRPPAALVAWLDECLRSAVQPIPALLAPSFRPQ